MINIKKKIVDHFHEITKNEHSEHSIALGFAIGTFINIAFPIPGSNLLIALLVILIFKRVNKLSIFVALALWNTVTLIPVYALSYGVGRFFTVPENIFNYDMIILNQIYNFYSKYLIGNIIVAFAVSPLSYFIVKKIVKVYRKRKKIKKN